MQINNMDHLKLISRLIIACRFEMSKTKFRTWSLIGYGGRYKDLDGQRGRKFYLFQCSCCNRITKSDSSLRSIKKTKVCLTELFEQQRQKKIDQIKQVVGKKINKWTILSINPWIPRKNPTVIARCECGHIRKDLMFYQLNTGRSKACKPCGNTTHGLAKSSIAGIWRKMVSRCHDIDDKDYYNYGGRGIIVCERWHSVTSFHADMGEKPFSNAQIDRINVDGDYELSNCRWVTPQENMANRRNSKKNRANYITIKRSNYKIIDGNYILIK